MRCRFYLQQTVSLQALPFCALARLAFDVCVLAFEVYTSKLYSRLTTSSLSNCDWIT